MQARIGPRDGARVGERQSLAPRIEVEVAVEAILDVGEAAEAKVPAPRNEVGPFGKIVRVEPRDASRKWAPRVSKPHNHIHQRQLDARNEPVLATTWGNTQVRANA